MITIPDLTRMLNIEHDLIHDQTNGLSHTDTLIQPKPGGNCMNWVLGHLLENQIAMCEALGGVSPIPRADLARYKRESEPITSDGTGIKTLTELLAGLDDLHECIIARLDSMTEAEMEQEITLRERTMTRGSRIFFLFFHSTYHIGQLEQLRQLAGKLDKVI